MENIVFLGYVVPPEQLSGSVAGNKMQWNVLNQLSKRNGITLSCVSVTPSRSFPHEKKIRYRYHAEQLFENVKNHKIGFWNIPIIKQLSQIIGVYRMGKRLVKENQADILFCFNLFPQIGIPMRWLKRKFPQLKTFCLLADLPIDDTPNRSAFSRILRSLFDKSTFKSMKKCEYYVTLNESAMKQYLPNKPYIIMDGGINPDEFLDKSCVWSGEEKNIIYTGALVDYSGIINLIKSIDFIEDKTVVLDIYGGGPLENEIRQISEQNHRIRFHGIVDNRAAMMAQQSSWLLANPRPVESEIAKVTFPSKIFEYLMSERPVMTTRLNGFSKDYDEILFWIDGETPEDIAECVNRINKESAEALLERAKSAKQYLLKNKTWEINAKKIHDFMIESFCINGENYETNESGEQTRH